MSKLLRRDYVFCYPLKTDMMLLHGYILLSREKLSAWCRAGLHMTAETLGASQVWAIQHADGKYIQTRHDKFMRELAQVCVSFEWLKCYMGRLWSRRFYKQQWYYRCSLQEACHPHSHPNWSDRILSIEHMRQLCNANIAKKPRPLQSKLAWCWLLTTVQRYTAQSSDILICVGLPPDNTRWRQAMRQLTCQEA